MLRNMKNTAKIIASEHCSELQNAVLVKFFVPSFIQARITDKQEKRAKERKNPKSAKQAAHEEQTAQQKFTTSLKREAKEANRQPSASAPVALTVNWLMSGPID